MKHVNVNLSRLSGISFVQTLTIPLGQFTVGPISPMICVLTLFIAALFMALFRATSLGVFPQRTIMRRYI
jgi:hypothetical protein